MFTHITRPSRPTHLAPRFWIVHIPSVQSRERGDESYPLTRSPRCAWIVDGGQYGYVYMTHGSPTVEHDHAIWLKGLIQELRVRDARLLNQRSAPRYQLNVPVELCAESDSGRVVHMCQAWGV